MPARRTPERIRRMNDERLAVYLRSLEPDPDPLLREMTSEAEARQVPILRPETAALLRTLTELKGPDRVLEVGTATGYSALVMSRCLRDGSRIDTIERNAQWAALARGHFREAGREEQITLLEGDASEVLPALDGPYDFVFLDAAKGQYLHFLPDLLRLLAPGGVLVSDNVLQNGTILESRYAIPRRDRTIHSRMREFLYQLKHREELETAVLPVGDGVALSVKRRNQSKHEET